MKVAIYARTSTARQEREETVQTQLAVVHDFCETKEYEVIEKYIDEGVSGALYLEQRSAGKRLLDAASEKHFEAVVIYDLSRLGRSEEASLLAARDLQILKVRIISATEPHLNDDGDPELPHNIMLKSNTRLMNSIYRASVRQNTMNGRYRKAQEGKFLASHVPYGYRKGVSGELEIDEEQARWVRQMFTWRDEEGLGWKAIARRLNELEVPTPNADHPSKRRQSNWDWHFTSVQKIVKHPRYMGRGSYKSIEVPYPVVVDEALFERVQEKGKGRFANPRSTRNLYILQHILLCGVCGGSYTCRLVERAGRGLVPTYQCRRRKVYGPRAGHKGAKWAWDGEELEAKVRDLVVDVLARPEIYTKQYRAYMTSPAFTEVQGENDLRQAEQRVRELEKKESKVLDNQERGVYRSEQQFHDRLGRVRKDLKAAEQRRDEVAREGLPEPKRFEDALHQLAMLNGVKRGRVDSQYFTPERWQRLFRDLEVQVTVEPDGELKLTLPLLPEGVLSNQRSR